MRTPAPLTTADAQRLEQTEADYFRRFLTGASDAARADLGIRAKRVGGGAVTAMWSDTSGYWSKALGLGFDATIDAALIADVVQFFRASGRQSGLIAVPPAVLPADWADICREHGITQDWAQSKLSCPVGDFIAGTTDLVVQPLQAQDVPGWERIIQEAFGMTDPDLTPMLAWTIEDPQARVFGAWDGDELVGAGAVHFVGESASINTGGTLPTYRGRGVQSALLAARATAAAAVGCRVLVAETAADHGGTSYRNLVRSGFTHHYDRTNWHWER